MDGPESDGLFLDSWVARREEPASFRKFEAEA
jgi:hypothetical protein